jgi:hypothetical protein
MTCATEQNILIGSAQEVIVFERQGEKQLTL